MAEDALAQDEIDALLSAAGHSDSVEQEEKKEPAGELAIEFLNSSKEILMALLGNDVTVEKVESGPIPIDLLAQEFTEPSAVGFVIPEKGLEAAFVLIFNEKEMTAVTDLILMGEGEAKDNFSEDDIDALKEGVNQIMGNLGQNISLLYDEKIAFKQAEISILPPEKTLDAIKEKIKEESFYHAIYTLKIEGKVETKFRLLLPLSIESEIEKLNNAKASQQATAVAESVEPPDSQTPAEADGTQMNIENIDLILDLKVEINVKLGETMKPLKDLRAFTVGDIVELNKAAGAPVDVIVNNKVIAKGELVVVPPYNFAINITQVENKLERIKNLTFL